MKQPTYRPTRRYANLTPADHVRIACELLGLTQVELARRAGLNTSHLSEMLHGKRAIGLAIAQRLSKVLGIPAARLLMIEEPADEQRKEIERALVRLRQHIKAARSIGEDTERVLLKDLEEAIEANRATA